MRQTEKGVLGSRAHLPGDGPFVAVIGGANVDIHGRPTDSLRLQDSNPGTVQISSGGVARNIAENLARLGANCRLITAVGDDEYGRLLIDDGRDAGIDMQHVLRIGGARTSTYLSILDDRGDMHVAINDMATVGALSADQLRRHESMLKQASLMILDTNLPADSLAWLTQTFSEQALFVDTVSAVKATKITPYLQSVHTLKMTRAEAEALSGMNPKTEAQLRELAGWAHERGVARLFITLGDGGVFFSANNRHGIEKPRRRRQTMKNSGGAGDAFLAGIAYAWLENWPEARSVQFALAAADVTLDNSATTSPTLSLDAVNRVAEGWHVD